MLDKLASKAKAILDQGLKLCDAKKPELFLAGGLIGIGVGVGFTVWGTFRTKEDLDDELAKECEIWDGTDETDDVEVGEASRACFNARVRCGVKIATNYVPAVAALGVGVAGIIASRNEYARRFAILSAGYNTLLATFNEYRAKVAEDYGKEYEENTLVSAYKAQKEIRESRDCNGMSVSEDKALRALGVDPSNDCTVIQFNEYTSNMFDRRYGAQNWYNVQNIENWAKNYYHYSGDLYLDKVLEMLGMDPKEWPMSHFVGWHLDRDLPGSDILSFGLDDPINEESKEHTEEALPITLVFNHHGVITPFVGAF